MLSEQAREAIAFCRNRKEKNKGLRLKKEDVLASRQGVDEKMQDAPVPEGILIHPIQECGISGEWYEKQNEQGADKNVIFFLHGGGYATGTVASRRPMFTGILSHTRYNGFALDYSQWPEKSHPAALEEIYAAWEWLTKEKGYAPDHIFLFGESAGAHLVLTFIMKLKEDGRKLPEAVCLFSPVIDMENQFSSRKEREERDPMLDGNLWVDYFADCELKDWSVSPRYGDYSKFPDLSIHVGSEEVLYDDAVYVYERCKEEGSHVDLTVWAGLFHVFPLFQCPEADQAMRKIGEFFQRE